jgi:CheY-like chemotaxis protein
VQSETVVMGQPDGRPSSAGLAWLRGKLILLAEDNITNQMVATQMLDALGARVEVASDGAEALEMMRRKEYDLYLVDIEMPRVSGLDVIRSIRSAEPPLRDAPVIAVTAYALREHRDKITEAGADGLIPKPLLGIEQFGRDIVMLADRSYERGVAAAAGRDDGDDIDLDLFRNLTEAVGGDDLAELLSKIDDDLARAERSVTAAAETVDRAALGAAAHVLVSVAGAVGAERLQTLARRLGDAAEGAGAGAGEIRALSADALRRIAAVRAFVREQSGRPKA